MKRDEFKVGGVFRSGHWLWQVTDLRPSEVVAMPVGVISTDDMQQLARLPLARLQAICDELFKDVAPGERDEKVFEESELKDCSLDA